MKGQTQQTQTHRHREPTATRGRGGGGVKKVNGNEKCKLPGMNAQVTGMELARSVGNVVHAIVTTVYIRCLAGPGLPGRLHCKAYG